ARFLPASNPRLTPWAAFRRRFAATPGKKTPIAALKRCATQNRLLTRSLTGHLRNGARVQPLQKSARLCRFILRVRRKNNEKESREAANNSSNQHHQRNIRRMEVNRLRQRFNRKRAVGVDSAVTRLVGKPRRMHNRIRRIELRHHSVNLGALHSAFTSASGKSVRISKIEIIGSTRRNKNMQARKNPIVPM